MISQGTIMTNLLYAMLCWIVCSVLLAFFAGDALGQGATSIIAWGDDTYGETNVPIGLTDVVAISAGDKYSLALRSDGTVVAWGNNTFVPAGLSNVVAIATGYDFLLALQSDGTVVAWGADEYGQI